MLRSILIGALILLLISGSGATQTTDDVKAETYTQWVVTPAAGLDALLLLGAASGDLAQSEIYADEIQWVKDNLAQDGFAAMEQIDSVMREEMGRLTGPVLAYIFSAGPVATLDDVIKSAANPVERLKPGHQSSSRWDEEEFTSALQIMPVLHTALVAMREAGFVDWYAVNFEKNILAAVDANRLAVQEFDVIPEQERLLGRSLDPRIEILIANFSKPYGIRILGQRFIAYYGYDGAIQLHVAAHEIFHSPFDRSDDELDELLSKLRSDPWMTSIVENHDPRFGYNSFMGIIDEGSTQALDQIVAERLGFDKEPGARWRHSDGGMHMFAAAVYHAMKEDGFADSGGNYSQWLKGALRRGALTPEEVRRRASLVVDQETVDTWYPT